MTDWDIFVPYDLGFNGQVIKASDWEARWTGEHETACLTRLEAARGRLLERGGKRSPKPHIHASGAIEGKPTSAWVPARAHLQHVSLRPQELIYGDPAAADTYTIHISPLTSTGAWVAHQYSRGHRLDVWVCLCTGFFLWTQNRRTNSGTRFGTFPLVTSFNAFAKWHTKETSPLKGIWMRRLLQAATVTRLCAIRFCACEQKLVLF